MNNYVTTSISIRNFSSEKKKEILDTEIDELYNEGGVLIRNQQEFFDYYLEIENDIPIFGNTGSHQFLVSNADSISDGEIIVYVSSEISYSFNNIPEIISERDSALALSASAAASLNSIQGVYDSLLEQYNDLLDQYNELLTQPEEEEEGNFITIPNSGFDEGENDLPVHGKKTQTNIFQTAGRNNSECVRLIRTNPPDHGPGAVSQEEDLQLALFQKYKLSFGMRSSNISSRAFIGDTRGARYDAYITYDGSETVVTEVGSEDEWNLYELEFTPTLTFNTGTRGRIYLYAGNHDAEQGEWAEYDSVAIEKLGFDNTIDQNAVTRSGDFSLMNSFPGYGESYIGNGAKVGGPTEIFTQFTNNQGKLVITQAQGFNPSPGIKYVDLLLKNTLYDIKIYYSTSPIGSNIHRIKYAGGEATISPSYEESIFEYEIIPNEDSDLEIEVISGTIYISKIEIMRKF